MREARFWSLLLNFCFYMHFSKEGKEREKQRVFVALVFVIISEEFLSLQCKEHYMEISS